MKANIMEGVVLPESFLDNLDLGNIPNFDLVPERQFQQVNTSDVENFLRENTNENTKRKTTSDMKIFKSFLVSKQEFRNLEFLPPDILNNYLCEFLLAVRKRNGQEYEPTSLRGIIGSVERYLKENGSKISIINDTEFAKTRNVLRTKQKVLKSLGLGNKPKTAQVLEDCHLEKMYAQKVLGDHTPKSVIHSLWLVCATHFGMRTGQEVHSLCWGDITLGLDHEAGSEFIVLDTERQTKTRSGTNPKDTRLVKPKAYAVPDDPHRDPVHLYKTYADMRPQDMNSDDSPFFLTPGNSTQNCSFRKSAMGINKLYNIMNEMKEAAGITEPRITPYSARKRLIQKLNDEGVPPNQIVQISGHKNVNSLNNYSAINSNQSKSISDILSNQKSATSTSIVEVPVQVAPVTPPTTHQPGTGPIPTGFFTNSTFNGNVSFYFSSRNETQNLSQVCNTLQPLYDNEIQRPDTETARTSSNSGSNIPDSPVVRQYKRIRLIPDSDSD